MLYKERWRSDGCYDSSYEDGIYDRGIQQGINQGEKLNLISIICRKLAKGKSVPVIADELEQDDITFVSEICKIAEGFAPDYDTGKIYEEYVKRTENSKLIRSMNDTEQTFSLQ